MQSHRVCSVVLALALCASACGPAVIPLAANPRAPAAQGEVRATRDDNGNNRLKIEVKHLAPPEKVNPGAKVYVVWGSKNGETPQNLGSFTVDGDLNGHLETTTPLHGFVLTITTEDQPAAAAPQGVEVLSARISR